MSKPILGKTITCISKMVLTLCLLLPALSLQAQAESKITVSGLVTSQDDGEPLIGVSVGVKGTSAGTVTDIDGKYTISVEKGKTLLGAVS